MQVGLPAGPLPIVRLANISLRVAKALEIYRDDPRLAANQIFAAGEETIFHDALTQLRRAGYITPSTQEPPNVGIYALDAHPLTALAAKTLAGDGRTVGVLGSGCALASKRACDHLRQQIAALSYNPAPPTTWVGLLTCAYVPDPARILPLMREDVPFVVATLSPWALEVSPLIVPGQTPCPMCVAHGIQARDATWQAVASQLRVREAPSVSRAALLAAAAQMVSLIPRRMPSANRFDVRSGWHLDTNSLESCQTTWRYSPRCSCREIAPLVAETIVAT